MEIPPLEKNSGTTLSRQLAAWFRRAATDGALPPGERLPATRELAAQLEIARNTVCEAYELLAAEGYIECAPGRRARIAEGVTLQNAFELSETGIAETERPASEERDVISFRTGRPDLQSIPRKAWARALLLATENATAKAWQYGPPEGSRELRSEIAAYLFRARGMRVKSERIFVSAGATHALHLLAFIFAQRGGSVAVEDPCHLGMVRSLQVAGIKIHPVEADEGGMKTRLLGNVEANLAYVTPSHQFPLGGILSAERRAELVRWAREKNARIIEDDYDAEFRYAGQPVAPLWTTDPDRVIYVGTFSKTLFPALRIGYAIIGEDLEREWLHARIHSDVQNPPFEQIALARLLADRTVDRHIARMRRLYGRRRQTLLAALGRAFADASKGTRFRVLGDASGLHVALRFPGYSFDEASVERAKKAGLRFVPAEQHVLTPGRWIDTVLLGYGHLDERTIEDGVERLKNFLAAEMR